MKTPISLSLMILAIAGTFTLTSCEQETFDEEMVTPDPFQPDTTFIPANCNGTMYMDSILNGGELLTNASAYIFHPTCPQSFWGTDSSQTNIVIVADSYDWGIMGPYPGNSVNGFPGLDIVVEWPINTDFAVYHQLGYTAGFDPWFTYQGNGLIVHNMLGQGSYVMFSEVTEDHVSGHFSGHYVDANQQLQPIQGDFCVPIALNCE